MSTSPDKSVLPTVMGWLQEKLGNDVFPLLNIIFSLLVAAVSYGLEKLKKPEILDLVQTVIPELGEHPLIGTPTWVCDSVVGLVKASGNAEAGKSIKVQELLKICLRLISGQEEKPAGSGDGFGGFGEE